MFFLLSLSINFPVFLLIIYSATDCHLGFAEKDPIRRDDSFNTFEEILKYAHQHEVSL